MKEILKYKNCPVSGLPITTKAEWKYIANDGSCTLEIGIIGDNILYEILVGIVDGEANKWYFKTINKIIAEFFINRKYYLVFDYSLMNNASLEAKKIFIDWFSSNSEKIELLIIFGMNDIMKVVINTGKIISKKHEKLQLTDSYKETINAILQKQNKLVESSETEIKSNIEKTKQTENKHINELIGYLGKMTWTGNLFQKIPVLPADNHFAELFAAVAANQEDLREIDKQKNEALKIISQKEIDAKKSNEQLKTIIKGANLGWWNWDIPSGDDFFNDILVENLGYKLSEVKQHISWWEDKIHPNDAKQVSEDLQKHLEGKTKYYENKHRLKTKNGKWKWFLDFGKVVERDKTGKASRMIGILRNIDKEERAEQNIRESEEYYRTLIENSMDAISIIDVKGNNIFRSKTAEKLLGYSNKERISENALDIILPEDGLRIAQTMKELIENPEYLRKIEFRVFHKDGTIIHLEGTAKNMLHSHTIKGIVLNYRDVTERVNQEKLLKQSELKFKGLFAGMSHGVVFCEAIYDENKNMVDCFYCDMNSAYEKMADLNRETAIGSKISEILPDTEPQWFSTFGEVVRTGKPISFEMYKTTTQKYYSVFAYKQEKDKFTTIFEDITVSKTNEKKAERREAYLNALNKISDISFKTDSATELQTFVEIIGKVANASRTYIFKNHKNSNNELLLSQFVEYVAEGIKPEIDNPELQNINYRDWIPRWEEKLKKGEIISGKIADFTEKERYLLEPQDIISLIVIPVFVEKTFWGFLGFDNCVDDTEWSNNDIKYFKIATNKLENSLELVARQKLLEAENMRFKTTMDAMNSGVYVADMQNYELLFLNNFFIDLIGNKTGEKCYKALHGLDEPCSFCTNKYLLDENQKPNKVYIWEYYSNIKENWYQLRNQAFRWLDGRMVRMEVAVDITEQKEANKQITKLSAAVEQTANSIVITDTIGNIEYINPQFSKITGYSLDEVLGKNPRILNAGTQPKEYYAKLWNTINAGEIWRGEFHNKTKYGKFYWEDVTISPIKENNEITNFLAVKQDITKQKESAEQIRKLSQVTKTTSQSIIITDLEGNTIFVNDALIKMGSFENESEIIGKSIYEFTDKQGIAKIKEEVFPNIFDKGIYYGELNLVKKDGTIYPAEINCSVISDETGNPEFLVAMFNDISDRKQAEEELIAAKEKAEESNRLKTAFLNNMSHEIRTPLNGITGFVGLLQNPDLDAEDKQLYIDVINKSSDRLIATVTDIIEISKIEAGIIKVSATKVLVNEVFNELYEFFSLEAENKGLKLKQLPGLSNDKAILLTDNHKLTGILTNLIKNAIKFTDKGSVTFGYSIIEDTEKGSLMQFYVKDTGIGVPDNKLQAIFNRFEQADIGDTRAFEGSGLGLSIAKSYVEALGGKIWLSSKEDIGTEFTFTIPYKTKENMAKKDEIQQELKNKQTNLKDLTVLIAEDEEVNIMLFDAVFKKIFKQIIYVENGQQAIDVCKNNKEIDLILMDIKMPIMNGYTATREIRKFNKDIFIIAQTAFGLEGDREKALETGCDDYISKPLNKEELFEKIKCILP